MKRLLIVNPNTDLRVTAWLTEEARRTVCPGFAVEAVNAASGLAALETPEHVGVAAAAVAQAISTSQPDAAIIGAFRDPGLASARALGIPVVGLGEAALRAAGERGRFAILTLGASMREAIERRVEIVGLRDHLVALRFLPGLISGFVEDREARLAEIAREIEASARAGAQAVLLGGAPFAGIAQRLRGLGAEVIDGVESAVTAATRAA